MSEEHIEARHGFVEICIGGGYECEPVNYTPDEAMEFAARLVAAARHCKEQKAAIEAACANGHDWDTGHNCYSAVPITEENKATSYSCRRRGCLGHKLEPGWANAQPRL